MHIRRRHGATQAVVNVLTAALFFAAAPVHAQSAILDDLLLKLKDKGVLSAEEYEALKAARDEERTEQRAERRRQALKEAQATEKEEKAKAEAGSTLKAKFSNGFVLESGDKSAAIGINGRVHADYRNFADNIASSTFDVRRAYLTVTGKVWDDFTFDVTGDFAQGSSPQLDVGWVNWGHWKQLQVRAGQFKMPMSLEELTSSRFIDFQERSLVNAYVPAKERGVMVHGTPYTGVFYGVALSNGQGKNNNEVSTTVDEPDLIARVGVNVAELIDQKDMVIHVAGAYSNGKQPTSTNGLTGNLLAGRTEARGVTFFQVAGSSFTGDHIQRERMLGEVSLAWGPVKLQGEYLSAQYSGESAAGSEYERALDVYYAEVLFMLTGESYASAYRSGAYGRMSPKRNLSWSEGGWGALELGLRYSSLDAGDFKTTNAAGTGRLATGFTNSATAWTVGLKWIMNPNVRAYLNYTQTDFDTPITVAVSGRGNKTFDKEQAITMRLGVDF